MTPSTASSDGRSVDRHPAPPALLNEKQAAALLGVSIRKFKGLRGEDWFPLAIELGPRALRWARDELVRSMTERAPRRTKLAEPAQLARTRIERSRARE